MQLVVSPTSPYARKARIVVIEKSLQDAVEIVEASPLEAESQELIRNPLGKVPCLMLANGSLIFDSSVICEYLDNIGREPSLFPQAEELRFSALRAQALGDGLLDAAYSIVMERIRKDAEKSQFWLDRWRSAIARALSAMEQDLQNRSSLDIGSLTYLVSLDYLDFRHPDIDWRSMHTELAKWRDALIERSSFSQTKP